ncbi:MAG TPA: ABC transporter substrate-binding protein [Trebonia sp.]
MKPNKGMTSGRWRAVRYGAAAVAVVALATVSACTGSSTSSGTPKGSASPPPSALTQFPRSQTLYTSGTLYNPPSTWNPFNVGNYSTGAQGLIYEPLFLYDPIKNTYIPWLAASGTWNAANTVYTIKVRDNVKWSDGTPLTGADVAFSINTAATSANDPYNSNAASVAKATASGNTVTVTFKGTPGYSEFQSYLYRAPVISQHQWSKVPAGQLATYADTKPVGTGPMTLVTYNATEVAYQVKPDWWGTAQLGLKFPFKYLVDVVNGSNNVELGMLTSGQVDWSNNFLPGINQLMQGIGGYGFKTFYPKAPYMMPANTVWLEMNTTKAPFSNVNFRKAVAYGINPQHIVTNVYSGLVQAANPTGLLPNLSQYIDQSVVSQYGYKYDPAQAKAFLAQSGYKGQAVTLAVPNGWTDWMAGAQVIAQDLRSIGINVQTTTPEYAARTTNLTSGNYDMALDNNAAIDSTPWTYFQRVYNLPIQAQQTAQLNWERFTSQADWALVQKAGTTPLTNTASLKATYSQLEKDFLQQLPEVPVWYNGAWFQASTQKWSGYPASGTSNTAVPSLWRGYIGAMTGVYALAALKPTPATP